MKWEDPLTGSQDGQDSAALRPPSGGCVLPTSALPRASDHGSLLIGVGVGIGIGIAPIPTPPAAGERAPWNDPDTDSDPDPEKIG